jgi:hypothetical protein
MTELYLTISDAISKAPGINWADMGPRVAGHTVVYPAAFVQDIVFAPEELGNAQYYGEFTFTVVIFIKPYQSAAAKPRPVIASEAKQSSMFAHSFAPVTAVRRAIYGLSDEYVQSTVFLQESVSCPGDGFYTVTQHWKGVAAVNLA